MKQILLILLAFFTLATMSCSYESNYGDLRGFHYGQGNGFYGKYRGKRHRYNWEPTRKERLRHLRYTHR